MTTHLRAVLTLSCVLLFNATDSIAQTSLGRVGDTELHWAAYRGHTAIVQRLLRSGAPVNQRVDLGSTALHLAAYKGHEEVVRLLIESGADVNARTEDGITPLDWARSNSHADIEALLLANGATVGKPLPVKSRSRSTDIAAAGVASPGQYLLSQSGKYREQPLHRQPVKKAVEDDFVEQSIRPEELEKLESVAQINQTLQQYREEQAQAAPVAEAPAVAAEAKREPVERAAPAESAPANAYRIQLAAVGDYERAQVVRSQFAERFSAILGQHTLVVEPVAVGERTLYRLRSSALTQGEADSVCEQIRGLAQDCIVVAPPGT